MERIWVEVNTRVNYPIKEALIEMLEHGDFSVDDVLDKFCVSWFTIKVAAVGIDRFVAAWNEHPIPGMCMPWHIVLKTQLLTFVYASVTRHGQQGGVPRMRTMSNNRAKHIDSRVLPTVADAVQQYQQQGGHLTDPYHVGRDPLEGDAYKLGVRQQAFSEKYPSFHNIFSKLVNGDSSTFKHALSFYISVTRRISSSV